MPRLAQCHKNAASSARSPAQPWLDGTPNCSGGFHSFPDLARALRELARITVPGGVLTASMFAEHPDHQHPGVREWLRRRTGLHFVPLDALGRQLADAGYVAYEWSAPRRGFGYVSARRRADGDSACRAS